VKMDPIDRQIIELLMEDGRMACAQMARRLGFASERTVRYRLERMIEAGVFRVIAVPIPRALGYSVIADVFIQAEPGAVLDVARQLAEFECVTYVGCAMGEQDVSIQVVARDNSEVYAFVTEVVGKIPGVRKTNTVILPKILKDIHMWRIPTEAFTEAKMDSGEPPGRSPE
jgi:DNA-binding Lrp family transcriptional regulator